MIRIFSHYVPGKLVVLAGLETLVLLLSACVGISMHFLGPETMDSLAGVPPQAAAFAIGMLIVMTSMGLYQPEVWHNVQSALARLVAAFLLGLAVTGLASHLVPSLYLSVDILGTTLVVALA